MLAATSADPQAATGLFQLLSLLGATGNDLLPEQPQGGVADLLLQALRNVSPQGMQQPPMMPPGGMMPSPGAMMPTPMGGMPGGMGGY